MNPFRKKKSNGNREAGAGDSGGAPKGSFEVSWLTEPLLPRTAASAGEDVSTQEKEHPEVPLFVEPIIAYRGWQAQRDGTLISAHYSNHRWLPRTSHDAKCNGGGGITISRLFYGPPADEPPRHPAPAHGCNCGVHGAKYLTGAYNVAHGNVAAIGTVKMWGRIIEHEAGYRAEHAYPDAITLIVGDHVHDPDDDSPAGWYTDREAVERVAQRANLIYGIPVDVMESEEWMDRVAASIAAEYANFTIPGADQ